MHCEYSQQRRDFMKFKIEKLLPAFLCAFMCFSHTIPANAVSFQRSACTIFYKQDELKALSEIGSSVITKGKNFRITNLGAPSHDDMQNLRMCYVVCYIDERMYTAALDGTIQYNASMQPFSTWAVISVENLKTHKEERFRVVNSLGLSPACTSPTQ